MEEEYQLEHSGTFKRHEDKVWSISWNADGTILASTSADKNVRIWGRDENNRLSPVDLLDHEHTKTVRSVSFSPNGNLLALGSFDSTISIWKLAGGVFKHIRTLDGHESEVKYVDWHPTKDMLATCSRDKNIMVWEIDQLEFEILEILTKHTQDVKMVKWVPDTDYEIASASYDDTVIVWDMDTDQYYNKQQLTDHASTVWTIAFAYGNKYMLTGSDDLTIKVYTRQPNETYSFSLNITGLHERCIYSLSSSRLCPGLVASGAGDDTLCLFKIKEPATADEPLSYQLVERRPQAHNSDINSVKFHPHLRLVATCGDDGDIRLWKY